MADNTEKKCEYCGATYIKRRILQKLLEKAARRRIPKRRAVKRSEKGGLAFFH